MSKIQASDPEPQRDRAGEIDSRLCVAVETSALAHFGDCHSVGSGARPHQPDLTPSTIATLVLPTGTAFAWRWRAKMPTGQQMAQALVGHAARTTCYETRMTTTPTHAETFTPVERAYIRSELDRYFTTLPTVAEGLMLRTWKTGPRAGQPKVGPAARSLLDRGFVSLDPNGRPPRLFFTIAGLAALRVMMRDRRLADPEVRPPPGGTWDRPADGSQSRRIRTPGSG